MDKPIILRNGCYDSRDLKNLKKQKTWRIVDIFIDQLKEFFEISNPKITNPLIFKKKLKEFIKVESGTDSELKGDWIYYPWSGVLLHGVREEMLVQLLTNRNQNLITKDEQGILSNARIAFAGLSIGNSMALSLAYSGIGGVINLSDFDRLSTSNLNRIRTGLAEVGNEKVCIAAHQIYELNPYLKLNIFSKGLKQEYLEKFMGGNKKIDMIFEAIDDFEMKVLLRQAARAKGIPVIMLTNLGDSMLIDIERYDLDSKLPLFNGMAGDLSQVIGKKLTMAEKNKYAVQVVGMENVPVRALESVREIGNTLVGRPQLMSTVTIAGGVAAYVARQLLLNSASLKSGRKRVFFADIF